MVQTRSKTTAANNQSRAVAGSGPRAFRDVTNTKKLCPRRVSSRKAKHNKHKPAAVVERKPIAAAGVKTRSRATSSGNAPNNHKISNRAASGMTRPPLCRRDPPLRARTVVEADGPRRRSYRRTTAPAIVDIDKRDQDDPACVTDYVQQMYDHFRRRELSAGAYMANQREINEDVRSVLVDWLVELHHKCFRLEPETLYLAVGLLDRYLVRRQPSRARFQLVGIACLMIASKYEEYFEPEVDQLVYLCGHAYTRLDVLAMEKHILETLDYRITIPSANVFLVRFLKAGDADRKMNQLARFLLDGTLQSYKLLRYCPSLLAAASVFIARRSAGRNTPCWSPTLVKYTNYSKEEIIPVARAILHEKARASPKLCAVNKKYSNAQYGRVASTIFRCDF